MGTAPIAHPRLVLFACRDAANVDAIAGNARHLSVFPNGIVFHFSSLLGKPLTHNGSSSGNLKPSGTGGSPHILLRNLDLGS